MKQGNLYIFTGINGSGKDASTTSVQKLLEQRGISVQVVYGPEINASTTAMRAVLLDKNLCPTDYVAQALLWFSLHSEATAEVKKLRETGVTVLLNRGPETTLVYNVLDRMEKIGAPTVELLRGVYIAIMKELEPTAVLLLDVDVETAWKRAGQQKETDHFQGEEKAFTTRRTAYKKLAKLNPSLWHLVDATPPLKVVSEEITKIISTF